jgi:hypothetical protein
VLLKSRHMLQIAGNEFIRVYQRQAVKLINYIYHVYIPKMPANCVASATRLVLFLEKDFIPRGTLEKMHGSKMDP